MTNIKEIRLLPSSIESLGVTNSFEIFLKDIMPKRGYKYYFPSTGMTCDSNTLILFQLEGKIKGYGILKEIVKEKCFDENNNENAGYYVFYENSLRYLETPITLDMLKKVVPTIKTFNQAKQIIDIAYLNDILELCEMNFSSNDCINYLEEDLINNDIKEKEKEAVIKVRVNQGYFKTLLLKRYNKCCLCNIRNKKLLIASHIKPWSRSNENEKLDINNGFLLCSLHYKLFDSGLISFNDKGEIIYSKELEQNDKEIIIKNTNNTIELTEDNKKYLLYHRENIYLK